jgi:hypothetical protein
MPYGGEVGERSVLDTLHALLPGQSTARMLPLFQTAISLVTPNSYSELDFQMLGIEQFRSLCSSDGVEWVPMRMIQIFDQSRF